ncbi:UNVERIFIED_CONTAM: hypothetical protein DES50_102675 [Williamsia faeni]
MSGDFRTSPDGGAVVSLTRWASVWSDLLQTDMALKKRRELANDLENGFLRRALWEAAVVAYGRMAMSMRKRNVDFDALLRDVGGADVLALHERIMDWRHGHVAHRRDAEFEDVELTAQFAGRGGAQPVIALHLRVSSSIGPPDDDEFVREFAAFVEALRNRLWATRLAPLAAEVAEQIATDPSAADTAELWVTAQPADRLIADMTLWDHNTGTGM